MAKNERADLKIQENKLIPDGKRAEDGRTDVSRGPQRKHDTPAYHDDARAAILDNSEPAAPNLDDDLVTPPGSTAIEGAGTDPNNPNTKGSGSQKK